LDRLVAEMYARGLSMHDIEEAFKDSTGEQLISRTAVTSHHWFGAFLRLKILSALWFPR
jgi:hypothetical protein